MQNLIGRHFGNYIIEQEIGHGGMAYVYRARDERLRRVCAIKVLRPEFAADDHYVQRFLREARSVARLEHARIVPIYDIGQMEGYYYIAMRYLEGPTLKELIQRGEITRDQKLEYLAQAAEALDFAHSRGIIHRDIKPANMIVDVTSGLVLTDFGVAAQIDDPSATFTGVIVGTPAYMAPEQIRGQPATARTDVYQLGSTAYELLTGSQPFADRPAGGAIAAHLEDMPTPVHVSMSDLSPTVSAVIERAMAKDPTNRFEDTTEFIQQLVIAVNQDGDHIPLPVEGEQTVVDSDTGPLSAATAAAAAAAAARDLESDPIPIAFSGAEGRAVAPDGSALERPTYHWQSMQSEGALTDPGMHSAVTGETSVTTTTAGKRSPILWLLLALVAAAGTLFVVVAIVGVLVLRDGSSSPTATAQIAGGGTPTGESPTATLTTPGNSSAAQTQTALAVGLLETTTETATGEADGTETPTQRPTATTRPSPSPTRTATRTPTNTPLPPPTNTPIPPPTNTPIPPPTNTPVPPPTNTPVPPPPTNTPIPPPPTNTPTPPPPPTPPAAPGSLSASATSSTEVSLSWVDNSTNESGFNVYTSTYLPLGSTGPNATFYTVDGLPSGTTTCFLVTAFNSAGESGASNVACATTP